MKEKLKKLVLLHSNDMHGDFLAENVDEKLVGGVSLLSGYVSKVRAEEPNTIYCIAGDMFRGSVIDSEFQGLSTIEIMNMLAPDVVTIGNHETDYGVAHLLFIEKMAKFPIINANLHIKTNNARLFQPHLIMRVDGMKILFIGVLTQDVIKQTKNDGIIGSFVNVSEAAHEIGRICDAYQMLDIDMTVILTHIGFEEDKQLAAELKPEWGIDLIIGGHSHTFLDEPCVVNGIPIVQAGTGTDQIGRFDILVNTEKNCIDSYTWKTIPIDDRHCERDEAMEKLLLNFKDQTDLKYNRVVTRLKQKLTHPERRQETALGNLFADALQECLGLDIMMVGSGSIRLEQGGPIITYGDLISIYPYDGPIYMVPITGLQFKRMVRFLMHNALFVRTHSEFYQFSKGVEIEYNSITDTVTKITFEGEPIADDRIFKIGLQKYHYLNLESVLGVKLEPWQKTKIVCTSDQGVLDEYFSNHQLLHSEVEGRLKVIK